MPHSPSPNRPSGKGPGLLAWAGAALLMVACCAGPAMIAGGVATGILGAIGAWLSNPWIIGAAAATAVITTVLLGRLALRQRTGMRRGTDRRRLRSP